MEENRERTQARRHPNGYSPLEVFEKAATKKDNLNHPNSLQHVNEKSARCRIEKKEENRERTQARRHPNGYSPLEVFEKAATKKDNLNHPNSLQHVNEKSARCR